MDKLIAEIRQRINEKMILYYKDEIDNILKKMYAHISLSNDSEKLQKDLIWLVGLYKNLKNNKIEEIPKEEIQKEEKPKENNNIKIGKNLKKGYKIIQMTPDKAVIREWKNITEIREVYGGNWRLVHAIHNGELYKNSYWVKEVITP